MNRAMNSLSPVHDAAGAERRVIVVPADRFFFHFVTLQPETGADTQVELALEGIAPFPLAQLYHGYLVSPDRKRVMIFAAYRRRFSAAETEAWASAEAVLPASLALTGEPPGEKMLVVNARETGLTGVAWDGVSSLPVTVLAQATAEPPDELQCGAFVADLRAHSGLPDAPVRMLPGESGVGWNPEGGLEFSVGEFKTARLPLAALGSADVRDRPFLAERANLRRRGLRLWRGVAAAAAVAGLAAALDLSALVLGGWVRRNRVLVEERILPVRRVETDQALAARIEDLANRRLRPFEMLGVISAPRPRAIQFLRARTQGLNTVEVEAQTPNAVEVGNYEAILRALPVLERVEMRDLRLRAGLTTFVLSVTFRPGAWRGERGPS